MEEIEKNKKHNLRLFPLYKMLSWDLLFFYAISFLFLSEVKGFSTAEILFADAFYPLFKAILQIPCTIIIDRIGKRSSLVVANTSISLFVLLNIGCNSIFVLILANLFNAFGFVIKSTAEPNILYEALPANADRRTIFSKKDGFCGALFYYFDAITSIIAGFLYVYNPYYPLVLCLIMTILSTLLSYKFRVIPSDNNSSELDSSGEDVPKQNNLSIFRHTFNYLRNLFSGFRYIFRSSRLRSLILFNGLFASFITIMVTIRRSLLTDINFSSEQFGITFAILGILSGISSSKAHIFHKKMKNKVLTYLGLYFVFSAIIMGLVVLLDMPYRIMVTIILIMLGIQYLLKGPYYTLIKQYLLNFSSSSMRIKIYSANTFIEGIITAGIAFLGAYMLLHMSSAYVAVILGCIMFVLMIFLLDYMRTKVGLKPEEYKPKDINIDLQLKEQQKLQKKLQKEEEKLKKKENKNN